MLIVASVLAVILIVAVLAFFAGARGSETQAREMLRKRR